MPLAADVVPEASEAAAVANLEQSIRVLQNGHLDTGLTGTYFMTKLLSESSESKIFGQQLAWASRQLSKRAAKTIFV